MNSELLYKFYKGTAGEKEAAAIKSWLDADPANMETFMRERKMFDAMTLLKSKNDIRAEIRQRNITKRSVYKRIAGVAAVVAVAFGLGWGVSGITSAEGPTQMHAISVPAGQRINITLPDGSDVWLNGKTTLEYPMSFGRRSREVKLDGQAYFDVAHSNSKTFVVHTDKGDVEVMGTKFDVRAFSGEKEFETVLMDGRVKVTLEGDPSQSVVLAPDMKAFLADGSLLRSYVRDYNPYRWKEGLICFSNASFESVVEMLEANYDVKVVIEKNNVPPVSYTGKFRITDGVDYALRVLQRDVDFNYVRSEDHNVIYIK